MTAAEAKVFTKWFGICLHFNWRKNYLLCSGFLVSHTNCLCVIMGTVRFQPLEAEKLLDKEVRRLFFYHKKQPQIMFKSFDIPMPLNEASFGALIAKCLSS